jgi:hypothetical protein
MSSSTRTSEQRLPEPRPRAARAGPREAEMRNLPEGERATHYTLSAPDCPRTKPLWLSCRLLPTTGPNAVGKPAVWQAVSESHATIATWPSPRRLLTRQLQAAINRYGGFAGDKPLTTALEIDACNEALRRAQAGKGADARGAGATDTPPKGGGKKGDGRKGKGDRKVRGDRGSGVRALIEEGVEEVPRQDAPNSAEPPSDARGGNALRVYAAIPEDFLQGEFTELEAELKGMVGEPTCAWLKETGASVLERVDYGPAETEEEQTREEALAFLRSWNLHHMLATTTDDFSAFVWARFARAR